MRKVLALLLVVAIALLLDVGLAEADGEYTRIIIPEIGLSAAIQPLEQRSDGGWPDPNHHTAWCLNPESWPSKDCLQTIYLHRDGTGEGLDRLGRGDLVYLDVGGFEHGPRQLRLQLRVSGIDVIPKEEEPAILGVAKGDDFALITCHPANDSEAPERLVVWLETDYGLSWAYVDWGDCLSQIAQRYGVSVKAIARANDIANPNFIRAGTWLQIPRD